MKAIETIYKGYRFRSRLEARWAVFFDALGIQYEYEPEGFDLGDAGWYLPDFYLPGYDLWIEVKPNIGFMFNKKCYSFAVLLKKDIILIAGNPYIEADSPWEAKLSEYKLTFYNGLEVPEIEIIGTDCMNPLVFAKCRRCNGLAISTVNYDFNMVFKHDFDCHNGCERDPLVSCEELEKAYRKARQARFEHDERER